MAPKTKAAGTTPRKQANISLRQVDSMPTPSRRGARGKYGPILDLISETPDTAFFVADYDTEHGAARAKSSLVKQITAGTIAGGEHWWIESKVVRGEDGSVTGSELYALYMTDPSAYVDGAEVEGDEDEGAEVGEE